ncbi:MAG: NDP-hexose 2,3-dehydratase family protein [Erysipelotrichaceae bacterium]
MNEFIDDIIKSLNCKKGNVNCSDDILSWIQSLNKKVKVEIKECSFDNNSFWYYNHDKGEILNRNKSFFTIKGIQMIKDNCCVLEHPIIIQNEIGYLGLICKKINGILNFLMQAKIEPGNINCVQISPTIQATKSNFTKVHGGDAPKYLEYFLNANNYEIIYDQIQSEQSSRFYKKRNRNIIVKINDDISAYDNFKWMTLGQIKEFMKIDNLVNMDTRTVISGIPLTLLSKEHSLELSKQFENKIYFNSVFDYNSQLKIKEIYTFINNLKMFVNNYSAIVPLFNLKDWSVNTRGVYCHKEFNFDVEFFNILIEGREVQQWSQPLFKSKGVGVFGLCIRENKESYDYLIKIKSEIGSFDKVEIGPTIQKEYIDKYSNYDEIEILFFDQLNKKKTVNDVMLSEEGGRFYHEVNRNVIIDISTVNLNKLPNGYFWVSYSVLNYFMSINNCINIQLRNLLSLLSL